LYTYFGRLTIDGEAFEIRPGSVSLTPPGAQLQYDFEGMSTHLYAHFRAKSGGKSAQRIAPMTEWGSDFARLYAHVEQGIGYFAADRRRGEARFWDVLWQMAGRTAGGAAEQRAHPAVTRLLRHIELHLAEDLRVPELAAIAELSHNHLTRLFRRQTGETVKAYICRRRAEAAVHLLTRSTLSIKLIAQQVGVVDLQAFNKLLRGATGQSPRSLRRGGSS
jgi:AraC-like DNA-binding protein